MPYYDKGGGRGSSSGGSGEKANLKRKKIKKSVKIPTPPELLKEIRYKSRKSVDNPIKLHYGDGEIRLEADGLFTSIQIKYEGRASFEADLPNNWIFVGNKNKLILLSMGAVELPSIICTYKGTFKIVGCRAYSTDIKTTIPVLPIFTNYNNIEDINQVDEIKEKVEKSISTYTIGSVSKFKIRSINNLSKQEELYYKDGTPVGTNIPIHYDERYRPVSGAVKTKESQILYRKKINGVKIKQLKGDNNGRYNNK